MSEKSFGVQRMDPTGHSTAPKSLTGIEAEVEKEQRIPLDDAADILRNGNIMPAGQPRKSMIQSMFEHNAPIVAYVQEGISKGIKLSKYSEEKCTQLEDEFGLTEPAVARAVALQAYEEHEAGETHS